MKTKSGLLAEVLSESKGLRARFAKKPNVDGHGFGLKIANGVITDEPCITVLVSKKVDKSELRKGNAVPKSLRVGNATIATDVIESVSFVPQSYPFGECLTDSRNVGTRSGFAKVAGVIMAFTCAHVVWGVDNNLLTKDSIGSWDFNTRSWRTYGRSDQATYARGKGSPFDFGYLDAALVRLDPLVSATLQVPPTTRRYFRPKTVADIQAIVGSPVQGFGVASGTCTGRISAALVTGVNGGSFNADFLVAPTNASGLTQSGDSGMLWINSVGAIV